MKIELPTFLLNSKLQNGSVLADLVDGKPPFILNVDDVGAFCKIWKNRLVDARLGGRRDLEERAKSILEFLSGTNQNIRLLMWADHKVSVIFDVSNKNFLLIDET